MPSRDTIIQHPAHVLLNCTEVGRKVNTHTHTYKHSTQRLVFFSLCFPFLRVCEAAPTRTWTCVLKMSREFKHFKMSPSFCWQMRVGYSKPYITLLSHRLNLNLLLSALHIFNKLNTASTMSNSEFKKSTKLKLINT